MRQFIKFFFAAFLAILVFTGIALLMGLGAIGKLAAAKKVETGSNAVLNIDLGLSFSEQAKDNPLAPFNGNDQYNTPGLYDLVRMIRYAKTDSSIKCIFLKCGENNNGLAASEEIRNALLDFKLSKKKIYAYADVIPQRAYYIANVANKIYCNPRGGLDWKGYSIQYMFYKQTLDKLEIEPQVFYAGKFKSATEPFRGDHMTDANKLQSQVFLNDLYNRFLEQTAIQRNIDTTTLHSLANQLSIHSATDALQYKLVDALKYDDEVKDEIKQMLGVDKADAINFVAVSKYAKSAAYKKHKGTENIALIFAQGDIVDGKGTRSDIGSESYGALIRAARLDDDIKAIVVRVNSGGGSAMASENIWRELSMAKKEKPVVLSFGDYAASGGYYMSCGADSIFAQPNTLTGSIGVFSIIPNLKKFYNNKLGVTFDGVKTAEHADMQTSSRPLTEIEKNFYQQGVDSIYRHFLRRVSEGRKINISLVDSIAQGRVWTGSRAVQLGLVDKIGGLQDAVDCAARMAQIKEYRIKEYPETQGWWQNFISNYRSEAAAAALKEELGAEGFSVYTGIKKAKQLTGNVQARLPFEINFY